MPPEIIRRWQAPLLRVAVYAAALLGAAGVVYGLLGQRRPAPAAWLAPVVLAALALALLPEQARRTGTIRGTKGGLDPRRAWTILWIVLGGTLLLNQLVGWLPIRRYGDWRAFERYIAEGEVLARWLAGNALLNAAHRALVDWAGLAPGRQTAALFLRCAATALTTLSAILLLRRWPRRLMVILPALTPIWLLFAAGHAEYYPFVAGLWLFTLAWAMDRPLAERSPLAVGALAALLFPLAYLGYAPQAALLILAYALAAPRRAPVALVAAVGTATVGILLLWPGSPAEFLASLGASVGSDTAARLSFPAYAGRAASPDSIFFSWSYALSPGHLWDLLLMQSLAGGVWMPLLALTGLGLTLRRWDPAAARALRDPRTLFLVAVCVWQAGYFVRMLPLLGPIQDIDIFFSCYLTLAFTAGLLLDRAAGAPRGRRRLRIAPLAIAACLGGTLVALPSLLVTGVRLPRARWGAEEFAAALQKSRDPALVRELRRGVAEGRVLVRPVAGSAEARVAGVTFDRWTRGSRAAVVLFESASAPGATPILRLACAAPPEHLPVRVTVVDGRGPPRELVFHEPGARSLTLEPLEAGGVRVVVFWADKGWPGRERTPRHLGVKLESLELLAPE